MLKRWFFYLAVLAGCAAFWSAHRGWSSWLLLLIMLWLPWFSLLVSLLPMLTLRSGFAVPRQLQMDDREAVGLSLSCRFPLPPTRCVLILRHGLTGQSCRIKAGDPLPTDHCGALTLRCHRLYVYDHLGLFRLPLRRPREQEILVFPKPIPMAIPTELAQLRAHAWQAKPGGGFSEHHELRLYRPGDSLNQIHWKLTAKTGKLMLREPMIPRQSRILVTLNITGSADILDRKLGRLLWLGQRLLDMELRFTLNALTGNGMQAYAIADENDFQSALRALLRCAPAASDPAPDPRMPVSWHFHIGGEADEA